MFLSHPYAQTTEDDLVLFDLYAVLLGIIKSCSY